MLHGTSAETREGGFALGDSIVRPFRGSKHNGVLFRAVPAYTDSDRTIEVLIPTLQSPSKMSKVKPSQGIAPKTWGRRTRNCVAFVAQDRSPGRAWAGGASFVRSPLCRRLFRASAGC